MASTKVPIVDAEIDTDDPSGTIEESALGVAGLTALVLMISAAVFAAGRAKETFSDVTGIETQEGNMGVSF